MLHYNFPPFSVGEARMQRGPGRREVGHGNLAERALSGLLPGEEDFFEVPFDRGGDPSGSSRMEGGIGWRPATYGERFDTVEVDGTYYRTPTVSDCKRWASMVPRRRSSQPRRRPFGTTCRSPRRNCLPMFLPTLMEVNHSDHLNYLRQICRSCAVFSF